MSQLVESLSGAFDKLPPHAIEAEMCLLASMMLDKEMVGSVVQIVDRDAFFQADHQIIWDVLVKLYEQNRPIDAIILREELIKRQLLDEVGGVQYLAAILNSVPSAAICARRCTAASISLPAVSIRSAISSITTTMYGIGSSGSVSVS